MELQELSIGLKSRTGKIELVPVGDVHIGTKNFDQDELIRTIKYIASHDDIYWIGMGDYLECIKPKDRRFDPRNIPLNHLSRLSDLVQSQLEEFEELFKPILTSRKCLGLHCGNHEEENLLTWGEDILNRLCYKYGLKNLGYQALTRIRFRRHGGDTKTIIIHSQHGHGGGRKPGAKINLLREMPCRIEADIYLMGHVHDRIIDDGVVLGLCHKEPKLVAKEKIYCVTGTYYRVYQEGTISYGEKRNYPPSSIGSVRITISPYASRVLHAEKL